jgi:hypothetical protein
LCYEEYQISFNQKPKYQDGTDNLKKERERERDRERKTERKGKLLADQRNII